MYKYDIENDPRIIFYISWQVLDAAFSAAGNIEKDPRIIFYIVYIDPYVYFKALRL